MQSHARRPLAELALGSVSARVRRSCRLPVLLVGPHRRPAPAAYESIVVALDMSELAETMLAAPALRARVAPCPPGPFASVPEAGPARTLVT